MDKFWNKSLTRKMIKFLLLGSNAAIVIFFTVFCAGNALLGDYFSSSDFIYNAETAYIEELRAFVQKESIPATDTSRLGEWAHKKGISHFTISRNRILIYDSTYSDTVILGQTEAEALHYNWQYFHSVLFSDGAADVYIYANYEMKYYILFYTFDAILSMSIWIILFALGIRKEVKYIQQLSYSVTQIELGSLNSEIPVKGTDELGTLAHGLDQMRFALIKKEENEKQMKAAQDKLVLGMAHDLRTPLTGLMTFLEIAKKQQLLRECVNYIDKAYAKSTQIRDLSNQLFEFFLINSEEQPMKLENSEYLEYALGEYLSELCGLLEMDGYQISIEHLCWKPIQIQLCTDYAGRIIDNLVSNIKKYADPTVPIELSSDYNETYVNITIRNKSAQPNQYVHGTGIGVKNIHTMMAQMNGICNVCIEPDYYSIMLSFPIIVSKNTASDT